MAGKTLSFLCNYNVESSDSDDYEDTEEIGLSLEKLNLGSRKKLLVISPNGVLVHRAHLANKSSIPNARRPDATYGGHLVFKRPFAEEFMRFCFERFEVGIWSSAKERNIEQVLVCAMGKLRDRLLFVWDQDECTDSGFKSWEKKEKPLFFKELKRVWEKINQKKYCQFNAMDTLLIDDKPYKALLNPPNTAIFPHTFNAAENPDDEILNPKGELAKYLEGMSDAEDVQIYVRENPFVFGQPSITTSHPDWGFYSKVIGHLQRE